MRDRVMIIVHIVFVDSDDGLSLSDGPSVGRTRLF